jgi:hypothetical protein
MSGGGGGLDIGKELANFDKSLSLSENAPLIAAATAMYLSGGTVGGETLAGAGTAGAGAGAAGASAAGAGIADLAAYDAMAGLTASAAAPAAAAPIAAAAPAAAASALPTAGAAGAAGVDAIGSGIATPYVGPQAAMVSSMAAPAAAPAATSGIAGMANSAANWYGGLPAVAKYGIPLAAAAMLADRKSPYPEPEPYDGPLKKLKYDPDRYKPLEVRPPTPYTPVYKDYRNMAGGGLADLGGYADYARGGRMLKGPGDGMSDSIPAVIAGKQPARLANDEFVVPADVVSHLGNGSSEAGAKQLYRMMDKVRAARTGKKSQAKQINPNKYMPA